MNNFDPKFIDRPFYVTDTLDLHGFFPEQVGEVVCEFLTHAISLKLSHVKIIHGKGKSRLKFEVIQILRKHKQVLDFKDAPPLSGSWGATLIELDLS